MGDSLARRWRWLGTYHAWRNRGRDTVQSIEPWIKIAMGGAFLSGYRNLGTLPWWEALAIGGAILVAAEIAMVCLGAFDFKNGVIHRQTQLNNEQDPWKVETLEILRRLDQVAMPTPGTSGKQAVLIPLETFNKPMPLEYAEAIRAVR